MPRGIRVYQLAHELRIGTDDVLRLLAENLHIEIGSHMAAIDEALAAQVRALAAERAGAPVPTPGVQAGAVARAQRGANPTAGSGRGAPHVELAPADALRFVRFDTPGRGPSLGLMRQGAAAAPGEERVADLTVLDPGRFASPIPWLRRLLRDGTAATAELAAAAALAPVVATLSELEQSQALLPPVDAPEVWAAGVTYEHSRDARDRETQAGAAGQTPYDRVYAADRPELFFKATGARVVGPSRSVGLRGDSRWQVPEPELALVLDEDGGILGYTLGNDLSCRDIEGENPLYLPQAKIYRCSCALGPAVLGAGPTVPEFPVTCTVCRGGTVVWEAGTSTARMRRPFSALVAYLLRHNWLPAGSVLLTGTGVVPPEDFSLRDGDDIAISSPAIGTLRNVARWI